MFIFDYRLETILLDEYMKDKHLFELLERNFEMD